MGFLSGQDWTRETRKAYVVLGCHRSGTSFLADSLRSAGVDMGTGGWRTENGRIVRLNRDIIKTAGGSWFDPPDKEDLMFAAAGFQDRIKETLAEYDGIMLWGMKDPRLPLTINAILPHISDDIYLIAIFRRPAQVAESLRRKGMAFMPDPEAWVQEIARRNISTIQEFMEI